MHTILLSIAYKLLIFYCKLLVLTIRYITKNSYEGHGTDLKLWSVFILNFHILNFFDVKFMCSSLYRI